MAESKYGRLFTEEDVRMLMAGYGKRIADGAVRVHAGEELPDGWPTAALEASLADAADEKLLTFPADEPLFLLRGQDKAAPRAIADDVDGEADYLAASRAAGAGPEHLQAVQRAADEMRAWQSEHPDRVKAPD